MANKENWLKGMGMGLMGYAKTATEQRRLALEEEKTKALERVQTGRLGVDKELMGLRRDMFEQDKAGKSAVRADTAIAGVQKRFDSLLKPGDLEMQEYVAQRMQVVQEGAKGMSTPEEMQALLDKLEGSYNARAAEKLDPESESYARDQKAQAKYLREVNELIGTANRKLSRSLGDEWTGNITDFVYLGAATRADVDPESDEALAADVDRVDDLDNILREVVPGGQRVEPPGGGRIGRDFGLMSGKGADWAMGQMYGSGEGEIPYLEGTDPYGIHTAKKGLMGVYEGYQKHIGQPFSEFMLGQPLSPPAQPTATSDIPMLPPLPGPRTPGQ